MVTIFTTLVVLRHSEMKGVYNIIIIVVVAMPAVVIGMRRKIRTTNRRTGGRRRSRKKGQKLQRNSRPRFAASRW